MPVLHRAGVLSLNFLCCTLRWRAKSANSHWCSGVRTGGADTHQMRTQRAKTQLRRIEQTALAQCKRATLNNTTNQLQNDSVSVAAAVGGEEVTVVAVAVGGADFVIMSALATDMTMVQLMATAAAMGSAGVEGDAAEGEGEGAEGAEAEGDATAAAANKQALSARQRIDRRPCPASRTCGKACAISRAHHSDAEAEAEAVTEAGGVVAAMREAAVSLEALRLHQQALAPCPSFCFPAAALFRSFLPRSPRRLSLLRCRMPTHTLLQPTRRISPLLNLRTLRGLELLLGRRCCPPLSPMSTLSLAPRRAGLLPTSLDASERDCATILIEL